MAELLALEVQGLVQAVAFIQPLARNGERRIRDGIDGELGLTASELWRCVTGTSVESALSVLHRATMDSPESLFSNKEAR